MGLNPGELHGHRDNEGAIPFEVDVQTNATDSTYQVFPGGCPYSGGVRVKSMTGIITGAGAASDTLLLEDGAGNNLTETVDVSALSDKDMWEAVTMDDLYTDIDYGENLRITTASAALARVTIKMHRRE